MSETCYESGCKNEGVHYRDWTLTGIGDFRYYCDEHIKGADRQMSLRDLKRSWDYKGSVLRSLQDKMQKAADDYIAAGEKYLEALNNTCEQSDSVVE